MPSASLSRTPADTKRELHEPLVDGNCSVISLQYIHVNPVNCLMQLYFNHRLKNDVFYPVVFPPCSPRHAHRGETCAPSLWALVFGGRVCKSWANWEGCLSTRCVSWALSDFWIGVYGMACRSQPTEWEDLIKNSENLVFKSSTSTVLTPAEMTSARRNTHAGRYSGDQLFCSVGF